MRFFLLLTVFFWTNTFAIAQQNPKATLNRPAPTNTEGYVAFGVAIGTSNYFGDIYTDISLTRPMLGLMLTRKLSPHLYGRLSLSWGQILGDDALSPQNSALYARNLHFKNSLKELSLIGIYEPFGSGGSYKNRREIAPYFLAGIALVHHNPQARIDGQWVALQPLGTEGQGKPNYQNPYNKVQVALPLGAGLRWSVNERLDLGIEIGFRILFFDYIDDVSGKMPNFDDLSNPLAQRLANRSLETTAGRTGTARNVEALKTQYNTAVYNGGNGQTYNSLAGFEPTKNRGGSAQLNDFYVFTAFHIHYIIDVGLKCPQVLKR